jgi:hypothetical protein
MLSRFLSVSVMFLIVLGGVSADFARAAAKEDAKLASEKPKLKAKPGAKKIETRLPPHYGDVVTEDQRKEVAGVFAKYNAKLAKLKAEIKSLTAERDTAMEAMLSAEQKEKLTQLRSSAKEKRPKPPAR